MSQPVYDPRGTIAAEARPIAARIASLEGARLAVLDNTKWNAGKLLREAVAILEGAHDFGSVRFYRKESFSKVAADDVLEAIVADNDLVLTAIAD